MHQVGFNQRLILESMNTVCVVYNFLCLMCLEALKLTYTLKVKPLRFAASTCHLYISVGPSPLFKIH